MDQRGQWDNRAAFILAAVGSAIGLGNLWRFPFKCYEHGGGAFLIAYVIALITIGIPLLLLEFSLGHRFRLAAPSAFRKVGRAFEWVGWWAVLVGFVIVTYYAVVMAWAVVYTGFSVTQAWGADPAGFFYGEVLGLTGGPFELGGVRRPLLIGLGISWTLIILAIWKSAKTVSKVVYLTVVLPWALLIIFIIRGVTLPGAAAGLHYYLAPIFGHLLNPALWGAAYGQVAYSVSIGFGIMIAYASFLPRRANITSSAVIIAVADGLTSIAGGFAVFGTLGYYAQLKGLPVTEVLKGGPGLAFITYPEVISQLPMARVFGLLFFLMLLALAVDSAFSLVEAVAAAVRDKWGLGHRASNFIVGGIAVSLGLIFTTGAGLYWLDIVDHFMEHFGLIAVLLVECIVLGWFHKTDQLRKHLNSVSKTQLGDWWPWFIRIVCPVILAALLTNGLVRELGRPYEGYPIRALVIAGWGVAALLPLLSILFSLFRGHRRDPVEETTGG
ncbi:MAG TPA: sodium-dependent transporter [candidate division WOR-3 bacterium]|uniref:Transporter n=1 Tax=candidate division WOR-3 bacterium TaxID=2052148 RepID=A0A7V0T6J9_UNCW3|nr:sodium-dependent transporter [candidate division WOR-3 bacterium]